MRALELLNRTTRKLSLTEAGQGYYDACAQILADLDEADARVNALTAAPRGTLRVNAAAAIAPAAVPLLAAFTKAFPEITLELVVSDRMPDMVEDGFDVAIRYGPEPPSSLIVRRLGSFRVICCAAPAYLAAHGTPRVPADLVAHNCLCYMYPGYTDLTREWRFEGPDGKVTTVAVSGNLRTNSPAMLRAAVQDGRGIVIAPQWVLEAVHAGHLIRLLPEYDSGDLPVVALYPHRQHLPAKVRRFIDFAVKHFAEALQQARPPEGPTRRQQ